MKIQLSKANASGSKAVALFIFCIFLVKDSYPFPDLVQINFFGTKIVFAHNLHCFTFAFLLNFRLISY